MGSLCIGKPFQKLCYPSILKCLYRMSSSNCAAAFRFAIAIVGMQNLFQTFWHFCTSWISKGFCKVWLSIWLSWANCSTVGTSGWSYFTQFCCNKSKVSALALTGMLTKPKSCQLMHSLIYRLITCKIETVYFACLRNLPLGMTSKYVSENIQQVLSTLYGYFF